ncbi:MAG: hypothetical protein ISS15_21135 [Alphaproteobacteria bacterium]|nr:hypothetical protein [Reyranella sp.]MBL6940084.1 hypothetical protein [Alphaproteobacteria bacterium]MBL7100171.1 hypothetical protein [Alphaproteobacteria bacterium]
MALSDIILLYLLPWLILVGVVVPLGLASAMIKWLFNANVMRVIHGIAVVVLAPFGVNFLRTGFMTPNTDAMPLYLRLSVDSYGGAGIAIAIGSVVIIGALLAEQIERQRLRFKAGDA